MRKISIYIATIIIVVILLCVFIFIIRPDNSSNNVMEVKGYEHIIQCSDTPYYWWQEWFFTDSLHYKYANEIYYAETYEEYFAMLDEFYPIELPENVTEYDKYKASVIQFDSLMSFPGEGGATVQMYLYQSYGHAFTEYTSNKITNLLKKDDLYSIEVDSAWNRYFRKMELVIDSVVMYRPRCLGTISGMESMAFTGFLKDSYLNSMLETIFYKDMDVPKHITISDEMIRRAFDSLRAHLMEPLTDYEDILCSAPVEIRIDAINQDQKAWDEFIHLRNAFERSLFGSKKHAYHNATNNLKWRKLWLLKNEYKCFGTGPDGYHDIFLPLDCSDEDLLNYDFGDRAKMSNTPY
jgi:hypothetical protein